MMGGLSWLYAIRDEDHGYHHPKFKKTFKVKQRQEGILNQLRQFIKPAWKTITAVDDISFQVTEGELTAFLGPNGAGKSTTLKMLMGILHPKRAKSMS